MFNNGLKFSPAWLALALILACLHGCAPEAAPSPSPSPAQEAKTQRRGPGGPMGVPSNPKIREAMGKLGKDESSLTADIGKKLEATPTDWVVLAPKSKEFVTLVTGLIEETPTKGDKETWSKHINAFLKSTQALDQAIAAKQLDAAKAAHEKITSSCMTCHRDHRSMPPSRGRGGSGIPGIPEVAPGAVPVKSDPKPAPGASPVVPAEKPKG